MRTLLVCSPGGHFRQLAALVPRMGLTDVVWAVSDNPQVTQIVGGESWAQLPETPSRDWRGALHLLRRADQILQAEGIEQVVSTGALPAVPFFSRARLRGLPCHYIESAARSNGPSMTGRIARRVPGVHLYTQYPNWSDDHWHYSGSVFDGYAPMPQSGGGIQQVVVTLGVESFGFRRAIVKLLEVLPAGLTVLWQTGSTDVSGLPIDAHQFVPAGQLSSAIAAADLVIAHSGVGSAITALDNGRAPFLLPRERRWGEHVDDHQFEIARELGARGLARWSRVADLSWEQLVSASRCRAAPVAAPAFQLRQRRPTGPAS